MLIVLGLCAVLFSFIFIFPIFIADIHKGPEYYLQYYPSSFWFFIGSLVLFLFGIFDSIKMYRKELKKEKETESEVKLKKPN